MMLKITELLRQLYLMNIIMFKHVLIFGKNDSITFQHKTIDRTSEI
jgi:hypothetical protein